MYEMYEEYNHSGGSSNHYGGSDGGGYECHPSQQQLQHEEMERRLSLQQQHQVHISRGVDSMEQLRPEFRNKTFFKCQLQASKQ
jgi:hypothetical protein